MNNRVGYEVVGGMNDTCFVVIKDNCDHKTPDNFDSTYPNLSNLDLDKYSDSLAEFDMTKEQEGKFLVALWNMMGQ